MNYNCGLKEEDFFRIYHPQRGGAIGLDGETFYRSTFGRQLGHGGLYYKSSFGRQHGHGIGGIFVAIGRRLMPFIKNIIWPSAKKALSKVAVDVLDNNRPWKEAVKEGGLEALKDIGSNIMNQSGSGIRRRRRKRRRSAIGTKSKKAKYCIIKKKKKSKVKPKKKTTRKVKKKPKFVNIFDR
jgi:hypothetical protein